MKYLTDKILTATDLQKVFSCGKNRAYQLLHASGFPTLKICGRYYVKQSELDRWIETYTGRTFIRGDAS